MGYSGGGYRWELIEADESTVGALSAEAGLDPLIARLLINRGIQNAQQAQRYLFPSLDHLHDPSLLPDYQVGVDRIAHAIRSNELIVVHGDYDADGVSSTALLARTFRALKARYEYMVPHRANDGYDIKPAAVERAAKRGAGLIITCDCGITAFPAIERARELGIDVVVTDHHEPGASLPAALAVIDPKRADSQYPFRELAGVGVAFKVAQGVCRALGHSEASFIQRFLDLAAIGTVADVVPLVDENRVLVSNGLDAVRASGKAGIQALINSSGLAGDVLTAYSLGFVLGPRINAVGRMSDAEAAVRLLHTQDHSEARGIAQQLEEHNRARREVQEVVIGQALNLLAGKDIDSLRAIVISGEGWNRGVVGIAAGRLVEMFNRPAVVLSRDADGAITAGSARSCSGIDLIQCLGQCGHLLEDYGGHARAAGLALRLENLDEFSEALNTAVSEMVPEVEIAPTIQIESYLEPHQISVAAAKMIGELEPFGEGNPEPVFASANLHTAEVRKVGDGKHLKLRLADESQRLFVNCIGFGMGELADAIQASQSLDICYNLRVNLFNGNESADLHLLDLRTSV